MRVRPTTPVVFFLGLALLCASAVELARWPYVHVQIDRADYTMTREDVARAVTGPDLVETAARLTPALVANDRGTAPALFEVVQRVVCVAAGFAFLGVLLAAFRRRVMGAVLLLAGGLAGVVVLAVAGLQVRLMPYMEHVCGVSVLPSRTEFVDSPELLRVFSAFVATMALLAAAAWLLAQLQAGLRLKQSLLAVGLGLAMVAVPCFYARAAVIEHGPWLLPSRPTWVLVALLCLAVLLSIRRPLYCSRFVSSLFLVAGVGSMIPALAVAHDSRVDVHEQRLVTRGPFSFVAITSCRVVELGPTVEVNEDEVFSGFGLGSPRDEPGALEGSVFSRLAEVKQSLEDLHRAFGDESFAYASPVHLIADQGTPIQTVQAIMKAHARLGGRFVDVVSAPQGRERLWTRPAFHAHVCALRIELADDGQPITDFADWPSLVAAADRAQGRFALRVK